MSESVLDVLKSKLNKTYVSDLRALSSLEKKRAANFLKSIKADAYTVADWNDTNNYMTGNSERMSSEEAKANLIEWLEK